VPHDAGLADLEPCAPRQHKQLHVERKSRDRQAGKERLGRFGAEQLEAALRVHDAGQREQADVRVERPSDEMPQPVLTHAPRSERLAGSDDDVGRGRRLDGIEKPLEVVGRHREVRIRHEPPGAARFEHPPLDRLALSAAPSPNQADAPIGGRGLFDDRIRPVAAPVVDDDQLPGKAEAVEVVLKLAQRSSDRRFFVEGGNDDGENGENQNRRRPCGRGTWRHTRRV
jgi:hypothetical protein